MSRTTLAYLGRRLLHGLVVLWAAYTLSFLILNALPGDPVTIMAGAAGQISASPEQLAALRAEHNLDKPLIVQYLLSLGNLLRGDLGTSYTSGQPVTTLIANSLPVTIELAVWTLLFALIGGVGLALAAAYSQRPGLRGFLAALPGLGVSLPTFWTGLVLLQIFAFRLEWIPALGARGFAAVVLPALTLALPIGAIIAQVLFRALESAQDQQFIATYRAAGLSRLRLLVGHALPVAALSLLSIAGVLTGQLLGGAVVVETVFTRNGLGRLAQTAVGSQDIPTVQGIVVFSAIVFVIVNLVTDLLYPVFDPRTRAAVSPRRAAGRQVSGTTAAEVPQAFAADAAIDAGDSAPGSPAAEVTTSALAGPPAAVATSSEQEVSR